MSPDWSAKIEPVPYAKMDNPQSLNLYAYVGNNPLSRNDPTGHYSCQDGHGHTFNCGQDIQNWLATVQKAKNALPEGSKKREQLERVLAFYGKVDTKNGVVVVMGNAHGSNGETRTRNGVTTITFDKELMNDNFRNSANPEVEKAATVAHEGKHGVDQKANGMPHSLIEDDLEERRAFTVQSYVNEGLKVDSTYGVWTNGAGFDQKSVDEPSLNEAVEYCRQGGCQ